MLAIVHDVMGKQGLFVKHENNILENA